MKTMMSRFGIASFAFGMLAMAGIAQAQSLTGVTTLSMHVFPEAALSVTTGTTALDNTPGSFGSAFTGTTGFTYKIRNGASTTAKITLQVTTDFTGTGAIVPSIQNPVTAGDVLTYSCTATPASGAACPSALPAIWNLATSVVTFAPNAHSTLVAGDTGSVGWSLTNDPAYAVGTYTAVVTFTISLT